MKHSQWCKMVVDMRTCYILIILLDVLNSSAVNGVVTELSCSSDSCIPQTVQYHCETNTTTLIWQQGVNTLGGSYQGAALPAENRYTTTIVPKDGGGISSNISFMADANNGTTIHCIDRNIDSDSIYMYNCSLIIG